MSSDHGYLCPECDYSTEYPGLMNEHISSHYLGLTNIANAQYGSMEKVVKIVKNTDSIEWQFRCNDCKIKFLSESVMKEHFASKHPNIVEYKCNRCDFVSQTSQGLAGHTRWHKNPVSECEKCGFKAEKLADIEKHVCAKPRQIILAKRDKSPSRKAKNSSITCKECDCSYSSIGNYNNHLKGRKHKCALIIAARGRIYCNDCETKFRNIKKFSNHIRYTHPGVYLLICNRCNICEIAHSKDEIEYVKIGHTKYCNTGKLTVLEAEKRRK